MSEVFDIADGFVDALVNHDPISATFIGVAGHDDRMSDYSPDSAEEMARIERQTLATIRAVSPQNERERLCRDTVIDEMECGLALHDEGEHLRGLNILHSPVQSIRMVFDMMPRATVDHWANIARRMEQVPDTVKSYRETLQTGVSRGLTASKRQTAGCADQAHIWSGETDGNSFFGGIADEFGKSGLDSTSLKSDLERAARSANEAYADLANYLRDEYMKSAVYKDGVGHDRYALHARSYNGAELDLEETYRWGWEQLGLGQVGDAKGGGRHRSRRHYRRGDRTSRFRPFTVHRR